MDNSSQHAKWWHGLSWHPDLSRFAIDTQVLCLHCCCLHAYFACLQQQTSTVHCGVPHCLCCGCKLMACSSWVHVFGDSNDWWIVVFLLLQFEAILLLTGTSTQIWPLRSITALHGCWACVFDTRLVKSSVLHELLLVCFMVFTFACGTSEQMWRCCSVTALDLTSVWSPSGLSQCL